MIDTTVVRLGMKAVWSEDIVMEGIWWQDIRMKASDFRGETPIPGQALVRSSDCFDKGVESSSQINDHSQGCSWICISLGGSSLSNHAPLGQILLFRQWSTVTYDHFPTKKVKNIPMKSITFFQVWTSDSSTLNMGMEDEDQARTRICIHILECFFFNITLIIIPHISFPHLAEEQEKEKV